MRLLPRDKEHGWTPYAWLVFLCFFFLPPVLGHAGWREWAADLLGTFVFLVFYFSLFWRKNRWSLLNIGGMVLLGAAFAPFNQGASVFFIFAASIVAFVVPTPKMAFGLLTALLAVICLESWRLHLSSGFWVPALVVCVGVGVSNVHFAERNRANEKLRMANQEIEHLAKVAERERIARDLHDVLGHTLSVIILKSELAGKLIDRDPERAKAEIGDVERTSREALTEVRSTIRGYHARNLAAELKQAKATLETAGLSVTAESTEVGLTPAQESVVALILREAVTNVVRHARARRCSLRLAPVNGNCRLEVQDDGRGGIQVEGNGLRGMRERIEALGGTLQRETRAGTRLTIQFPLTPAKANGNQ